MTSLAAIERAVRRDIFLPPLALTGSEWADRFAVIPKETGSAEPGQWRTSRAPYQRGILDAFADQEIEEVCVMKSSRVGYTAMLMNAVGMWMADDPSNILCVLPDEFTTRTWSRTYLAPMIRETPRLRNLVHTFGEGGARHGGNATLRKEFPGGSLVAVWSSSANRLRNFTARRVVLDEIDGMESTPEGDPIPLAEKRAESFQRRRKIIKGSSPTIKGRSRIEAAFELSDKRYFMLPCPDCGHRQRLIWENIKWDDARPEDVCYACASCGSLIPHTKKQWMLDRGEWVATRPGRSVAGFHISSIYSPWVTWAFLRDLWERAQKDEEQLQTFFNTVLGETWELRAGVGGVEGLMARSEVYPAAVPAGVGVLTAAVDIQGDRFEIQVEGWGDGEENWKIQHHVINYVAGDQRKTVNVTDTAAWNDLHMFLTGTWKHESGCDLPLRIAVVDSGAYTDEVYAFTAPRRKYHIYAVKGMSKEPGKALLKAKPTVEGRRGARFWGFYPNAAKDTIYARLRIEMPGARYVHFPESFGKEWFDGLLSESPYVNADGRRVYRKRNKKQANEPLDLSVMNLVALRISGVSIDRLGKMAEELRAKPAAAAPEPVPLSEPDPPASVAPSHVHRRRGNWVTNW